MVIVPFHRLDTCSYLVKHYCKCHYTDTKLAGILCNIPTLLHDTPTLKLSSDFILIEER